MPGPDNVIRGPWTAPEPKAPPILTVVPRDLGKSTSVLPCLRIHVLRGYYRKRTWRERLLGVPWRPLRGRVYVPPALAPGQTLQVGDTLYCHPDVFPLLTEKLTSDPATSEPSP